MLRIRSPLDRGGWGGGHGGKADIEGRDPLRHRRSRASPLSLRHAPHPVRCAAFFVPSEKSNALVGDGFLQPAPRSANLDSAKKPRTFYELLGVRVASPRLCDLGRTIGDLGRTTGRLRGFSARFPRTGHELGLARTWSTWSAIINLTSRAGELRSAPSGPDARYRVADKGALALRGARSPSHARSAVAVFFCLLGQRLTAILRKTNHGSSRHFLRKGQHTPPEEMATDDAANIASSPQRCDKVIGGVTERDERDDCHERTEPHNIQDDSSCRAEMLLLDAVSGSSEMECSMPVTDRHLNEAEAMDVVPNAGAVSVSGKPSVVVALHVRDVLRQLQPGGLVVIGPPDSISRQHPAFLAAVGARATVRLDRLSLSPLTGDWSTVEIWRGDEKLVAQPPVELRVGDELVVGHTRARIVRLEREDRSPACPAASPPTRRPEASKTVLGPRNRVEQPSSPLQSKRLSLSGGLSPAPACSEGRAAAESVFECSPVSAPAPAASATPGVGEPLVAPMETDDRPSPADSNELPPRYFDAQKLLDESFEPGFLLALSGDIPAQLGRQTRRGGTWQALCSEGSSGEVLSAAPGRIVAVRPAIWTKKSKSLQVGIAHIPDGCTRPIILPILSHQPWALTLRRSSMFLPDVRDGALTEAFELIFDSEGGAAAAWARICEDVVPEVKRQQLARVKQPRFMEANMSERAFWL